MEVPDNNREEWLKDEFIPYLISIGGLHIEDKRVVDIKVDVPDRKNNFMASNVYFVKVSYESSKHTLDHLRLVIKLIPAIQVEINNLESQFFNEITMYTEILPEIGALHLFPTFYYGINNGANSIIVLEDIRPFGYRMTDSKHQLSSDHIEIAVKKLGQYHGHCYRYKEKHPGKLKELCSKLIDVRALREGVSNYYTAQRNLIKICARRGINYLKSVDDLDEKILEMIDGMLENSDELMWKLMEPSEPLSILLHGDFCRNNMMFKYDENGKPIEVKFFDLQLSRYASPANDLSFFLYMNADYNTRENKFEHIISLYHESMLEILGEHKLEKYNVEHFIRNYEQKHMYGFIIAVFFSVMMYDPAKVISVMDDRSIGLISSLDADTALADLGGKKGDAQAGDIVKSVYNKILNQTCT